MIDVRFVPTLKDNYSYLIIDKARRQALLIDPADAEPILSYLETEGLSAKEIWITHHHSDHTAGIDGILQRFRGIPVVCSQRDIARIPQAGRSVKAGSRLEFAGEPVTVLEVPGHAEGHIAFHFTGAHHLFSGDVLFGASCGAVFGGTYDEMHDSLAQLKALPPQTLIWCGHEYTGNNLHWAEHVLGKEALAQRKADYKVPSIPLLLQTELATNPFLRLDSPAVKAYAEKTETREVFQALRKLKDKF